MLVPPRRPVGPFGGPSRTIVDSQSDLLPTAHRLWKWSWIEYLRYVKKLTEAQTLSGSPPARVLIDRQHRDTLWNALRTAQRRLLITSDQLGPEVVNRRLLEALRERLQSGVTVVLVYRRLTNHGGDTAIDQLTGLATGFPDNLYIVRAENHAKMVVVDDSVAVSSFNFLSFEGYYENGRKQRSEVGIVLSGRTIADQMLNAVWQTFAHVPCDLTSVPSEPLVNHKEAPSGLPRSFHEAQELLNDLLYLDNDDDVTRAELLRNAIRSAADPWRLLDQLSKADLPSDLFRVAVADALSVRSTDQFNDIARTWLCWLARDAWTGKRFVEAAVLVSAYPDLKSPAIPRRHIVTLAAAWAVGTAHTVLPGLWTRNDLEDAEKRVIAAVSLLCLMLEGTLNYLDHHLKVLPSAWKALGEQVEYYWNKTYAPLPIETVREQVDETRHRDRVHDCWRTLKQELQKGRKVVLRHRVTNSTRNHLYRPNAGQLALLCQIADQKDLRAVAKWLSSIDDISEFLDHATREAVPGAPLLTGKVRRSFLSILQAVVNSARSVTKEARLFSTRQNSPRLLELARPVAETIHDSWKILESEISDFGSENRVVLEMLLDEVSVLKEWRSA